MYNMADRQSAVDAFFSLIDFVLEPLVETAAHLSSYIPPHLLNPSYLSTDHSGLQEGWGPVFSRGGSDLMKKWKEVEDIREAITTGWTALIIIIILAHVIFYTRRNETGQTPANNSATFVKTNNGSVETDISTLLGYEVGSESSSASTSRSNSGSTPSLRATAAASSSQLPTNGQPNANDSQSHNRTPLTEAAHASNTPPHLVLIEYIHPKLSSFWPAYYLRAFHRAQQSSLGQTNAMGGHVDAPPSSGTRNNKDGCVGMIVLEKKIVREHLKNGVMEYRRGIKGLVS